MPRKKLNKTEIKTIEKEQYLKINQNAAGLTFGAISFILSIILIISLNAVGNKAEAGIPLNSFGGIILFVISAFIEGTILGYIVAWTYNKFIYIAK